jgi:hypothetical protein
MTDFLARGVSLRLAYMGFKKEYLGNHGKIEKELLGRDFKDTAEVHRYAETLK